MGFAKEAITSRDRRIRKTGLMTRPTQVRMPLGRREKKSTSRKKTSENPSSHSLSLPASSGSTPTVKEVVAHRGMAKQGPMVRYSSTVKKRP